nr:hypothetical protein Q903MT_gene1218 [Picea sitchensis]
MPIEIKKSASTVDTTGHSVPIKLHAHGLLDHRKRTDSQTTNPLCTDRYHLLTV